MWMLLFIVFSNMLAFLVFFLLFSSPSLFTAAYTITAWVSISASTSSFGFILWFSSLYLVSNLGILLLLYLNLLLNFFLFFDFLFRRLDFSTISNFHSFKRFILVVSPELLYFLTDIVSFLNSSKYSMLAIKMRGCCIGYEKLWSIGILSCICHWQ